MPPTPLSTLLLEGCGSGQIGGDLEKHGEHALGFVAFAEGARFHGHVVDLGSGVGLPAFVLADAIPQTTWTLIERRAGRAELLQRGVARMGWSDRVEVLPIDAVQAAWTALRGSVDWVTARLFGPPGTSAEIGSAFLRPGGGLLVSVPRDADPGDTWPMPGLTRCGLEFSERWVTEAGCYVRLTRTSDPIDLPRRGARKRLLF